TMESAGRRCGRRRWAAKGSRRAGRSPARHSAGRAESLPTSSLQQDLDGHRNRAALRDQIDREMEADTVPFREPVGLADRVARTLQLFGAPLLDPVELGIEG